MSVVSDRTSSVLMLLALWFAWGANWVITKLGLAYASAFQLGLGRTVLAIATLALIMRATGRRFTPTPWRPTFWLGLTQTAGFVVFTNLALVAGGAGKVSVLCYTMPFWTLLLARLFLHEKLAPLQWLGVALALVGLLAILEPWDLGGNWLSDALAITGGLVWASSAIIAKKLRAQHQVDTLALTFWQMVWGTLVLALLLPLFPGKDIQWGWPLLGVLLFSGVLAGGLGWLVWMLLLSRLSAGMAGMSILAIPAVAVLMAWLLLAEVPSHAEALGMLLIAAALILISLYALRREWRR
ncbi:DMT family transporter [Vogesella indigofera]|uniref:DMT family transporter n=1 Tax=Vogesella indigofera TaxID=45465 RepID=UPI00234F4054|nr:DMT family transporter [Vogesella indigofera]MDC7711424.1 DMT family transporter [Vogesella indigofera]